MKGLSQKQVLIVVFVFIVAVVAALFGVFSTDSNGIDSITWNDSEILNSSGDLILTSDEVPSSIKVSENSEFGTSGDFKNVSLSPDKKWIAFSIGGAVHDSGWLYEIEMDTIYPVAFQYGGGVEVVEWSPDSQFIAFNIGTPAPTEYIKVVNRDNISKFPPETGKQLRLEGEAGLTPPFSYKFIEWQTPHTICVSLNEAEDCFDLENIDSE